MSALRLPDGKYIEGTQQTQRVHTQMMHLVDDTRWNLLGEILIYSNQDATDASLLHNGLALMMPRRLEKPKSNSNALAALLPLAESWKTRTGPK